MVGSQDRLHACRDYLLSAQAVTVGGREGLVGPATFDEGGDFRFVGETEPVDEFRQRPAVVAHREDAARERLHAAAASVSFHPYLERLLFEAADVDLSLLAEDDRLDAGAGYVISADRDFGGQLAFETLVPEGVLEGLFGRGEAVRVNT